MKPIKVLPISYNGAHCYNIELQNSFEGLADAVCELGMKEKRLCIVADSNVDTLYGDMVQTILEQGGCCKVCRFSFP